MNSLLARVRYGRVVLMIAALLILAAIVWHPASAFSSTQTASLVIGQPTFSTNTCSGFFGNPPTRSGLCFPLGSAFDSSGNLWVADTDNNRVLEFKPPFSNGQSASLVIGQSTFVSNACSGGLSGTPTQSGLCIPFGLAFDSSGNLWVADDDNNRVLEFTPPFSNGENASLVLGQSSFTTNTCNGGGFGGNPSHIGLCNPISLALDSSGNLWVADFGNGRVLEFTPPFSNDESALLVLGQSGFTTNTCSGLGGNPLSQSGLCGPSGLAFDSSGNLWVSDGDNNRVLKFTSPFSNGESASLVLGQSSFTSNGCSVQFTCAPGGLAFDSSGNLWVPDHANSRVLEFKPPFSDGESASLVIGQPTFATNTCSGFSSPLSQSGLCAPSDLAFDSSGNLWVADSQNNRIVEFTKVTPPVDFTASASPTTLFVERGHSATVAITLTSLNGFAATISLTATIAPLTKKSPSLALSTTSLTPLPAITASSTLTITPVQSLEGDGTYAITVTATSGSITHTITVQLTVFKG